MGFFDDYTDDVDSIPTGFGLPLGTYPVIVSEVKNHSKEDGTQSTIVSLTVDTLNDEENRSGREDIWLTKPVKGAKNAAIHASIGKQWMQDLGIPKDKMGIDLVEQKDNLIGITGVLTVTAGKEGYTKKAFKLTAESSGIAEGVEVPAEKAEAALDLSQW